MWIWVQMAAAIYLVGGALVIDCKNFESKIIFKAVPMLIGLPMAFYVTAKFMGWQV